MAIDWDAVIQKGLESAAEAFGAQFGGVIGKELAGQIASSLLGGDDEETFAEAITELKEVIRQTVDHAFLREHSGAVLGLGQNLSRYLDTGEMSYLDSVLTGITGHVNTLLEFESHEALSMLIYTVNVDLLALRVKAGHDSKFYPLVVKESKMYAEKNRKNGRCD
ncbi:putative Fe-S cluster-containing radical SAM superfamily protein [Paenibacillus mucilaginosus]|uniref:hypothetical protein n=1 Tax=Paenibacillus mucilaginosus TaxID=61624 RepID=UPI003D1D3BA6